MSVEGGERESTENLETKKKKECLRKVLEYLERDSPHFDNVIYNLTKANERDFMVAAFNIYYSETIELIDKAFPSRGFNHYIAHAANTYLSSIENQLLDDTQINSLGRRYVNLFALMSGLMGHHEKASMLYSDIEDSENAKKHQVADEEFKSDPLKLPERKAIWEKAVREFIDETKESNPFKSEEERDLALEKLKTNIQNKINELS